MRLCRRSAARHGKRAWNSAGLDISSGGQFVCPLYCLSLCTLYGFLGPAVNLRSSASSAVQRRTLSVGLTSVSNQPPIAPPASTGSHDRVCVPCGPPRQDALGERLTFGRSISLILPTKLSQSARCSNISQSFRVYVKPKRSAIKRIA
jgi:hypothetical protein